jgi:lipid-A-disaccharide synthase
LNSHSRLQVALVAGEASGDALAAGLMAEIRARVPAVEFYGVAGDRMVAAGCEAWFRAEGLSLIGLTEIVRHVPRLYRMRRALLKRIAARSPDVFIGIDTPGFNISVEARLRRLGIPTVQYVSPQVWAWRQSRVARIREATDLVLCILPFEAGFYEANGVNACFVGHPMADEIPFEVDRAAARAALGLPRDATLLALLPGSRPSEVSQLSRPFLEAAGWLRAHGQPVEVAVALASDAIADVYRHATTDVELSPPPHLVTGRAREIMAAADLVLAASGTATLEAALLKRPMVVAYRISPLTLKLLRGMGLGRLSHYSLPNLLAGRRIVPEFVQEQVRGELLGAALREFLDGRPPEPDWYDAFTRIHRELRCDASAQAATAILDLLAARSATTKF